jgi:hypothetical protein
MLVFYRTLKFRYDIFWLQTTTAKCSKSKVTEIATCQGTSNGILISITIGDVSGIIEKQLQ